MSKADEAHTKLVAAAHEWATKHMDQWEKFKFETPHGWIYVSITMTTNYPDSFDKVELKT